MIQRGQDEGLKGCPFCGSPAEIVQASNDPRWWIIRCTDQAEDAAMACMARPEIQDDNREMAIVHWNHREPSSRADSAAGGAGVAWRYCWLIEQQIEGRAAWRSFTSFKPNAGWTHDANEALQFARKKDADDFMAGDAGDGEIYVAQAIEHGFATDQAREGR